MTLIKLEDAVKALEELYDDGSSIDGSINCDDAIEALRSLPTDDGVTDEMVERAARALADNLSSGEISPCQWFIEGGLYSEEMLKEIARAVMKAALGPLPAPPAIGGE